MHNTNSRSDDTEFLANMLGATFIPSNLDPRSVRNLFSNLAADFSIGKHILTHAGTRIKIICCIPDQDIVSELTSKIYERKNVYRLIMLEKDAMECIPVLFLIHWKNGEDTPTLENISEVYDEYVMEPNLKSCILSSVKQRMEVLSSDKYNLVINGSRLIPKGFKQ